MQRYLFAFVVAAAALGWLLAQIDSGGWLVETMALLKTLFLSVLKMVVAPLVFFSLLAGILRLRAAVGPYAAVGRHAHLLLVYHGHRHRVRARRRVLDPSLDRDAAAGRARRHYRYVHQRTTSHSQTRSRSPNCSPPWCGVYSSIRSPALAELNIPRHRRERRGARLGVAAGVAKGEQRAGRDRRHHGCRVPHRRLGRDAGAAWRVAIVYQMSTTSGAELLQGLAAFCRRGGCGHVGARPGVLPLIAWLVGGRNPLMFARQAARAFVVALSTSSSAATLPVTFQAAQSLRVEPHYRELRAAFGRHHQHGRHGAVRGHRGGLPGVPVGIQLDPLATATVFLVAMMSSIGRTGHSVRVHGRHADGAAGSGHSAGRHRRAAAGGAAAGRRAHGCQRGGRSGGGRWWQPALPARAQRSASRRHGTDAPNTWTLRFSALDTWVWSQARASPRWATMCYAWTSTRPRWRACRPATCRSSSRASRRCCART